MCEKCLRNLVLGLVGLVLGGLVLTGAYFMIDEALRREMLVHCHKERRHAESILDKRLGEECKRLLEEE